MGLARHPLRGAGVQLDVGAAEDDRRAAPQLHGRGDARAADAAVSDQRPGGSARGGAQHFRLPAGARRASACTYGRPPGRDRHRLVRGVHGGGLEHFRRPGYGVDHGRGHRARVAGRGRPHPRADQRAQPRAGGADHVRAGGGGRTGCRRGVHHRRADRHVEGLHRHRHVPEPQLGRCGDRRAPRGQAAARGDPGCGVIPARPAGREPGDQRIEDPGGRPAGRPDPG